MPPPFQRLAQFLHYLRIYRSELRLLKGARFDGTIDALWRYLKTSQLSGIAQKKGEIEKFLGILKDSKPRVVIEIGTAQGGTLLFWTTVVAEDACIITVDLPHGPFGGGHRRSQAWLYRRFAKDNQEIHFIEGDSHESSVKKKVNTMLCNRQVDFLFIDGDHSREGVEKDYRMYSPYVKPGGIIAFHDIVPGEQEFVGGVPDFWKKLTGQYAVHEIVEDWGQGGFGIGWFVKPESFASESDETGI